MNSGNDDERKFLRHAALKGIGHALRRLFEIENSELPANMRHLALRIEASRNLTSKD
jgi:hypothetical protein